MASTRTPGNAPTLQTVLLVVLMAASLLDTACAGPVPNPDPDIRAKRYVVSLPPTGVNLTGWVPAVVPLGQAVFGSRPYIIG